MTARVPLLEDLVRDGTLDPRNVEQAVGLADWEPLPPHPGQKPLSETLEELRDEEDG
ncbi:hypothetical protein [Streptacidiphilus sp. EB129]|uniref:hypothetical protein n=1 Tax=Streptacidiphilus sp. EB129 TaxID=3156262 RepID=UPI0035196473